MWFETLTGFREHSPEQVRANITLDGDVLRSRANGRVMHYGRLETPTLAELRERVREAGYKLAGLVVREVVADVRELHLEDANAGALFQVASQFNLLEMMGPEYTPEHGVGIYERNPTQGPACAIACGAGTIYRNYFAPVNGRVGQTADNQIDCLAGLGEALGNADSRLWRMRNGYALPSRSGLEEISSRLKAADEVKLDRLRQSLRVGLQWDTEVTLRDSGNRLTQAYCSALPVAYAAGLPAELWEEFARLVLEAAYEATFCAGLLNAAAGGSNKVFLTLLGGGAFGNRVEWIIAALRRALDIYRQAGLEIAIVSYGSPKPFLRDVID